MRETTKTTKAAQREATTARLIELARAAFARDGYAGAATEQIVEAAGVTRGALYHHFGSKEGLFHAVLRAVQAEVGAQVEAAASAHADPWQQLAAGSRAFLQSSLDPTVQRIMLVDGPAVLGWAAWRALDAEYSMRGLREALEALAAAGDLAPLPVEALTHLLSGAMNEAALWIASADDPPRALEEAAAALDHVLASLRR